MIKSIDKVLSDQSSKDAPSEVCPNCWGRQEYGDKVRCIVKDRQKDYAINDPEHRLAFIEKFVLEHVDGIRLVNEPDGLRCLNCHNLYEIKEDE